MLLPILQQLVELVKLPITSFQVEEPFTDVKFYHQNVIVCVINNPNISNTINMRPRGEGWFNIVNENYDNFLNLAQSINQYTESIVPGIVPSILLYRTIVFKTH